MSDNTKIIEAPKERLKFIDMARSIAILMMLEGHFTGAALASEYRTHDYLVFKIWHIVHGLTSPLFFSVTGLIFVYLLIGNTEISFKNNPRVKKGRKRIFQLLFWGYLIQLNLFSIIKSIYYGTEFHFDWFYAFHVLQSIAIGLALVIFIYRIYKWINKGNLFWYYLLAAILMFTFYALLKEHIKLDKKLITDGLKSTPSYLPKNASAFIQNMFYGKYSDFSFVRMSGYTILGGMMGALIRSKEIYVKKWWFGTSFIIAGIIISIFTRHFFIGIDDFTDWIGITYNGVYELNSTSISRFGQVVSLLGILMLIDKYFKIKSNLFLKIGQNTFPIYVVHVIILYGGIFGFGLKPMLFNRDLPPLWAIAISSFWIIVFIIMVKYIKPLQDLYYRVFNFLRLKRN